MQVLSVLSLAGLALAAPSLPRRAEPAALLTPVKSASAKVIPDQYIVKMKDTAEVSVASTKYKAKNTYKSDGFKGFAATLSAEQLKEIRDDPNVDYVEHNQKIDLFEYLSQDDAPWGITRISHTENGATNYLYDSSAGEGTCVYVIDTGIKVDHPDFEGRAEWVQNFTDDGNDGDGAGHGTWSPASSPPPPTALLRRARSSP